MLHFFLYGHVFEFVEVMLMYRFDACCVHAGAHPSLRECVCLHAFGCGMAWPSLERMENAPGLSERMVEDLDRGMA